MIDHGWGLARLPAVIRKTKRGMAAIREASAGSPIAVPRPGPDTPPCSLNAAFTPQRRFARASLPLADVKLVKDVAGVTVNDVVLSVVAGALALVTFLWVPVHDREVLVAQVRPKAGVDCRCSAFEGTCAWLVCHAALSAVAVLLRVAWHSVNAIVARVVVR